jgi:hypothetical protein
MEAAALVYYAKTNDWTVCSDVELVEPTTLCCVLHQRGGHSDDIEVYKSDFNEEEEEEKQAILNTNRVLEPKEVFDFLFSSLLFDWKEGPYPVGEENGDPNEWIYGGSIRLNVPYVVHDILEYCYFEIWLKHKEYVEQWTLDKYFDPEKNNSYPFPPLPYHSAHLRRTVEFITSTLREGETHWVLKKIIYMLVLDRLFKLEYPFNNKVEKINSSVEQAAILEKMEELMREPPKGIMETLFGGIL